jgi:hypothetical protein
VSRTQKRIVLAIAAVVGLGLAWIIQPLLPPYKAHTRLVLTAPPGTGDWNHHLDDWCRSLIVARGSELTGAVAAKITHPAGRADAFDIVISSRDREFSLAVVRDIVTEALQTPGLQVQVLDPPEVVRFSDPSPAVLLTGLAFGSLVGFFVIDRAARNRAAFPHV